MPSFGLGWAFNFGSPGTYGKGIGLALDSSANVYVSGFYSGMVDFDPNHTNPTSSHVLTSTGYYGNNFAAKYLADGTFQWATDLSTNLNGAVGVTTAVQGGAVYAGFTTTVGSGNGAAVTQLDAATGAVSWTTTLTTGGSVRVGVAAGPAGSVYATGNNAASQVFVSRLDAAGNVTWTATSSGAGTGRGISVAVDGAGNAYATGQYDGTTAFGTMSLSSWSGTQDAFVWKLNAGGGTAWAGTMGSNGADFGEGVALDSSGNLLVCGKWGYGTTSQNNNFNPNSGAAVRLTPRGSYDAFVAKLALAANGGLTLSWAKNIGGPGEDGGLGVAVDTGGNVYTIGQFSGTVNFNPNNGTKRNLTSYGAWDIFVSKLDPSGNYVDAARFGGTGIDFGRGIAVDGSGNAYVTGSFVGTGNFSPSGTYNLTANGNQDVFVAKLTQGGTQAALTASAKQAGGDINWLDGTAVRKRKSALFADWLDVDN